MLLGVQVVFWMVWLVFYDNIKALDGCGAQLGLEVRFLELMAVNFA